MVKSLTLDSIFFNSLIDFSILIWIAIFITISLIFIILTFKKREEKKKKRIVSTFWLVIEKALFWEPVEGDNDQKSLISVPAKVHKLLRRPDYRQWFIDELINVRKNLTGHAAKNMKKLYEQLELYKSSLRKLHDLKWYVKAKGIQELYLMDQEEYVSQITPYTNHVNENVRMEAQLALVEFYGFKGLQFLDDLTQPVSFWNRIKLLHQVSDVSYQEFTGLDRWLGSTNDSVILFALRLTGIYHVFNMHDLVIECLDHANEAINLEALRTLSGIYNDHTAQLIEERYHHRDKTFRISALQTLAAIGSHVNIDFLLAEWNDEDPRVRMEAARAIICSSPEGVQTLEKTSQAAYASDKVIIEQLKTEVT